MGKRTSTCLFVIVVIAATLVACGAALDVPVISGGRALEYYGGEVINEHVLTRDQARLIAEWLRNNGNGWAFDANSYAPDVLVFLDHKDGGSSGLYVFPDAVVFVSDSYQRKRVATEREVAELVRILGFEDKK